MKYRYDPNFHPEIQNDIPPVVYHVTSKKNVESILKTGLKAKVAADGCKTAYVYAFTKLQHAERYAGKNGVIIEIKTDGIPETVVSYHSMADFSGNDIIRFNCNLRPDRIRIWRK